MIFVEDFFTFLIYLITSIPEIFGILISTITKSGLNELYSSIPFIALFAVRTVYPNSSNLRAKGIKTNF